jgi:membrane protein implicated in regulation of membrane protease activity
LTETVESEQHDPKLSVGEKVEQYRTQLKLYTDSTKQASQLSVRKSISVNLESREAFQQQLASLKKGVIPVAAIFIGFLLLFGMLFPGQFLIGIFLCPVAVLIAIGISRREHKPKTTKKEKEKQKKPSTAIPPPPPPPPSLPLPPKPQKQKDHLFLGSIKLTVMLLLVTTLMCFLLIGTSYFVLLFSMLVIFYFASLSTIYVVRRSKGPLNVPETKRFLEAIETQKCLKCGSTEKDVGGSVENGEVILTCKKCGTTTKSKTPTSPKPQG